MNLPSDLTIAYEACKAVNGSDSAMFCYSWVADSYKFQGVAPWHLRELAKRGYLTRLYSSRGGNRAYYRLNPDIPR
jgi:hypothetical protein